MIFAIANSVPDFGLNFAIANYILIYDILYAIAYTILNIRYGVCIIQLICHINFII
jgi:hypothetical protein